MLSKFIYLNINNAAIEWIPE